MIRAICLLVFLCTIGLARAQAQSGVITLTVVDAETGEEVPGAVIEIVPKAHPDQKKYYTSGYKGALQVRGLAYGSYTLAVTFMGYEKAEKEFRVTQPSENLGKIALREAAIAIETVVKEVQALRTSQKGDTVSYNANAFKVTADADVEGLLKKMPGITVNNGAVEAQGETIQKVFVDGKEFFGEDNEAGEALRDTMGELAREFLSQIKINTITYNATLDVDDDLIDMLADNLDPEGTVDPVNTLDLYGEVRSSLPVSFEVAADFSETNVAIAPFLVEPDEENDIAPVRLYKDDIRSLFSFFELNVDFMPQKYYPRIGFSDSQSIRMMLHLKKRGGLNLNL